MPRTDAPAAGGATLGGDVEIFATTCFTRYVDTQSAAPKRPTSGRTDSSTGNVSLELKQGDVIQEYGWDEDVDEGLRSRIASITGEELVDEDYSDVCDGALVWWRDEDGDVDDLADLLVDAKANLDDGSGNIWVMVPAVGEPGSVRLGFVDEAARVAGLSATTSAALSPTWTGVRLTARGPKR